MADLATFLEKLKTAVTKLETVDVVTAVGPCTWNTADSEYAPTVGANVKVMKTQINLLSGDTLTQLDEAFVTGDLKTLRDYHAGAAAQGRAILESNIQALKSLFDLVVHMQRQPA